ncbi:MAG: MFS transporter [Acidimicrobiales bacterium]|jgi:predicted MFS family arabinose efflux permease
MKAPGLFRSLRRRNFRLFLGGQLVSSLGTWMQNVALAWLVLQITHSPLDVGVVSAVQFVPSLAFGAYGGVVADRFPKRNLLVFTQSGLALAAASLATLDLTGLRPLWAIYGVTFVSGTFGSLDMPTRQAFVSEMVGLDDLPNAVGLNSATFNLTRIGGPALGALVIDVGGVGDCFALNALSYLAVIGALLAMRRDELFAGRRVAHARGQVRQGLRYIRQTPRLRHALLLLAVVGTLAFNFNTVLPVLAKVDFKGDASTYALLLVGMGVGSVAGALTAARARDPRLRVVVGAALAMGAVMLVAAAARSLALEVAVLVALGFFSLLYLSTTNSTCQLASAPEMRGRVMGIYSVIFTGSTPVGALLIGLVDQELGARWGFVVGAVPTLVAAAVLGAVLSRHPGAAPISPRSRLGRRRGAGVGAPGV